MKLIGKAKISLTTVFFFIGIAFIHFNSIYVSDSLILRHVLLIFFMATVWWTFKDHFRLKDELEDLRSMIPICAWCKKVRLEKNDWIDIDTYVKQYYGNDITHGICPTCYEKVRGEMHANR